MKTSLLLIVGLCLVALASSEKHKFKKCHLGKGTANHKAKQAIMCQTCKAVLWSKKLCKKPGKNTNSCAAIKEGDTSCAKSPANLKKSFPKFSFNKCTVNKEVFSEKNEDALTEAFTGQLRWKVGEDDYNIHYQCALLNCCKHYPEGAFEPFPREGRACQSDMNPSVFKCEPDGDCGRGWTADPDDDDFGGDCDNEFWDFKADRDYSFIEKRSHHLRKN